MNEKLDDKDLKILDLLKEHADYSTREIAKKTLLPITTIHNRIQKLRKQGVIQRYTIDVDYSRLDRNFVAYVLVSVNLRYLKTQNKTQYDIIKEMRKFHFVERVDIVTGLTDLVVIMRTKDVEEFDKCLMTKLQLIEGVEKTQSLIVIHSK